MQHSFSEKYKTLANAQLLEVISNRGGYVPEAIEAAEAELRSRNLSPEATAQAQASLFVKEEALKKNRSPLIVSYEIVNRALFPPRLVNTEKTLRLICFLFVLSMLPELYRMIAHFDALIGLIRVGGAYYVLYDIGVLVSAFLFTWLLWTRRKWGWILFCMYLYSFVISIVAGWLLYLMSDEAGLLGFGFHDDTETLCAVSISGAVLYYMNKKRMRALFKAHQYEQTMPLSLAIGLVVLPRLLNYFNGT